MNIKLVSFLIITAVFLLVVVQNYNLEVNLTNIKPSRSSNFNAKTNTKRRAPTYPVKVKIPTTFTPSTKNPKEPYLQLMKALGSGGHRTSYSAFVCYPTVKKDKGNRQSSAAFANTIVQKNLPTCLPLKQNDIDLIAKMTTKGHVGHTLAERASVARLVSAADKTKNPGDYLQFFELPLHHFTFTLADIEFSPSFNVIPDHWKADLKKRKSGEIEIVASTSPIDRTHESYSKLISTFKEILKAINAMHSLNYSHMDIKADNIRVDSAGALVLTDFGMAKPLNNQLGFVDTNKWHARYYPVEGNFNFNVKSGVQQWDMFALGLLGLDMLFGGCEVNSNIENRGYAKNTKWTMDILGIFGEPIVNGVDFRQAVSQKFVDKTGKNREDCVEKRENDDEDWDFLKKLKDELVCEKEGRSLPVDEEIDRAFVDLCLSMMRVDWKKRITTDKALQSEIFNMKF